MNSLRTNWIASEGGFIYRAPTTTARIEVHGTMMSPEYRSWRVLHGRSGTTHFPLSLPLDKVMDMAEALSSSSKADWVAAMTLQGVKSWLTVYRDGWEITSTKIDGVDVEYRTQNAKEMLL